MKTMKLWCTCIPGDAQVGLSGPPATIARLSLPPPPSPILRARAKSMEARRAPSSLRRVRFYNLLSPSLSPSRFGGIRNDGFVIVRIPSFRCGKFTALKRTRCLL